MLLADPIKIVEAGDADVAHGDIEGSFDAITEVVRLIRSKGEIVGFNLVETAPQYDPTNGTPRVAAMTMLNFMGQIMKNKK